MAEIYILSQDDKLLTTLSESTGLISAPFKDQLNNVPDEPFVFTVEADLERAKYVKEENRVVFRDKDGDLREYVIKEIDDLDNNDGPQTTATCEPAFMELNEHVIEDRRFVDKEAQEALNAALQGTRWTGTVEVSLGKATTNFYYISSVDAIWNILEVWGGEFKDVVTFDGNKITKREIRIKQRLGADRGAWFEIDHNIEEIGRTVLSYPVTALYGRGASLEIEDEETGEHTGGYTRLIDFADVEWKKSKGDPVDKPKGQKWVGDPDALLKYGRKHNGQLMHREGIFENGDYEDPAELLWATWQQLQEEKKPEVNYRLAVHLFDKPVSLGDTVRAFDRQFTRPIEIQTRVIAIEYDILDIEGTTVVEMGQFLSSDDDDVYREIEGIKNDLNKPRPTKPIDGNSFPDIKPGTPVNVEANGSFREIQLFWDYDSKVYISHYEVYGSQVKDFVPDSQHMLWRGRTSAFNHEVDTDQVWYYRVRAVNTRGTPGDFSPQVSAATVRIISDDILFGSIIADHLSNNLDIADKLAQNTIDRINQGPMQEIQYTQEQIEATENRLLGQLNSQIGDVNASINDLLTRTSGIEGTVTSITQEVDDIEGRLSTTITQLSNTDGVVSEHTTTLQQHAGLISAKAEKNEVYTKTQTNDLLGNKVDYTVYNNKMASLDIDINGISNKVTNTETNVNSLNGELANAKSQIAQLDIRADGIVQSVSEVRADLDGLEIGTRNIIRDSDMKSLVGWARNGVSVIEMEGGYLKNRFTGNTSTPGIKSVHKVSLEKGTYTLTVRADTDNLTAGKPFNLYLLGGTGTFSAVPIPRKTGMSISSVTFEVTEDLQDKDFYMLTNQPNIGDYILYDWVVLTKGNKSSLDWSPAPEDTDARITSAETLIEQKADKLALSAVSTSVDSLTGRMSNAESSINLLSTEIDLKVNKDGVIAAINVSPEGVRISGNKHHITGQTLIDDAVIGTAAIANAAITRAKLGTAVVGTAQIENAAITDAKIHSLSADKLTAGSIRGIDIYGAKFRSSAGTDWMEIVGGNIHLMQTNGRYVNISPTGLYGYNAGGDVRFQADSSLVTSAALGTANSNVYLAPVDWGEVRVVSYNTIPGGGSATDYSYRPIRAQSFISPPSANAYIGTDGELRVTNAGTSGIYRDVRANGYYGNFLDARGDAVNIYVRPATSDGELRVTTSGSTGAYRDVRARNFAGVRVGLSTAFENSVNFYITTAGNGEVRVVSRSNESAYRPIKASDFLPPSSTRETKKQIERYEENSLDIFRDTSVYTFLYKYEKDGTKKHLGVMLDEVPEVIHAATGDTLELYSTVGYVWKGVKDLVAVTDNHEDLINDHEDRINWLKIENQYLKQKIKLLEEKIA